MIRHFSFGTHFYDKADNEFTKRMKMLLNLTHEAPKLMAGSTISQKRELFEFPIFEPTAQRCNPLLSIKKTI
jgi:hypothetical protein